MKSDGARLRVNLSTAALVLSSLATIALSGWFAISLASASDSSLLFAVPVVVALAAAIVLYTVVSRSRIVAVRERFRREHSGSIVQAVMLLNSTQQPLEAVGISLRKYTCIQVDSAGVSVGMTPDFPGRTLSWSEVLSVSPTSIRGSSRVWAGLELTVRNEPSDLKLDVVVIGDDSRKIAALGPSAIAHLSAEIEAMRPTGS
jgi:hypothetical protein